MGSCRVVATMSATRPSEATRQKHLLHLTRARARAHRDAKRLAQLCENATAPPRQLASAARRACESAGLVAGFALLLAR